jgi:hypothetical protein
VPFGTSDPLPWIHRSARITVPGTTHEEVRWNAYPYARVTF